MAIVFPKYIYKNHSKILVTKYLIKNVVAWEILLGKKFSILYFQVTQVMMGAILEQIVKNRISFTFSFRAW